MQGPPAQPPASDGGETPLSVAAVAAMVARVLDERLPRPIRVVGEVSNFNDRTHWYFRLKDEQAVLDCVMFAAAARKAGFTPRDGDKVLLRGRVEFYGKQGRTQFYAEAMEPIGAGDLERRLRELIEELRGLGWLDPERKRPLPTFPRRIAIITSRTGASLQDVLSTMRKRCPAVDAVLIDVRVQGEGAAADIAAAINRLGNQAQALGIDAIIVTRGGGSIEDLWAFNERIVAEAIVRCAVPVVAAIGHETDTTIAELVADERAATPTQAAMRLTPDRAALTEQLDQLFVRARSAVSRRVERGIERLRAASRRADHAAHRAVATRLVRVERLGARLALVRPEAVYAARRARVIELGHRLRRAIDQRRTLVDIAGLATDLDRAWRIAHERRAARVDALDRELAVTGPRAVLARGYSVTTGPDGRAIRSRADVSAGDPITTIVADGGFTSIVGDGAGPGLPAAPREAPVPPRAPRSTPLPTRKRRRDRTDPGQPGLFGE